MPIQNTLRIFFVTAMLVGLSDAVVNASDPNSDPISEIKKIEVAKAAFDRERAADKPLVIKDEKTAKKYFGEKALKTIKEKVDFEKQHVLVFAWAGSGRDKLTYDVAESFPEQVRFQLTRGLTRDLRRHVRVFVVRKNVKWSTK